MKKNKLRKIKVKCKRGMTYQGDFFIDPIGYIDNSFSNKLLRKELKLYKQIEKKGNENLKE